MTRSLLVLVLALLASCAARRGPCRTFSEIETWPITYSGQVTTGHLPLPSVEPTAGDATPGLAVWVEATLVDADRAEAIAALDLPSAGIEAATVSSGEAGAALRRLVAAGDAVVLSEPSVLCLEGKRAQMSVVNKLSYLQGFELKGTRGALVADPTVGTLQEGMVLIVRPEIEGPHVELDVELIASTLTRPMAIATQSVGGAFHEMQLQVPVMSRQRLATSAQLLPSETLLLSGISQREPGRLLVAFLEAGVAAEPEPQRRVRRVRVEPGSPR